MDFHYEVSCTAAADPAPCPRTPVQGHRPPYRRHKPLRGHSSVDGGASCWLSRQGTGRPHGGLQDVPGGAAGPRGCGPRGRFWLWAPVPPPLRMVLPRYPRSCHRGCHTRLQQGRTARGCSATCLPPSAAHAPPPRPPALGRCHPRPHSLGPHPGPSPSGRSGPCCPLTCLWGAGTVSPGDWINPRALGSERPHPLVRGHSECLSRCPLPLVGHENTGTRSATCQMGHLLPVSRSREAAAVL